MCPYLLWGAFVNTFSDLSLSRFVTKPTDVHKNTLLVARLQAGLVCASSWYLWFSCCSLGKCFPRYLAISIGLFVAIVKCDVLQEKSLQNHRGLIHLTSTFQCQTSMLELGLSNSHTQLRDRGSFRAQLVCSGFFSPLFWYTGLCPGNAFCPLARHVLYKCGFTHRCSYLGQKNPRLSCWWLGSYLYSWVGSYKNSHHLLVDSDQGQINLTAKASEVV